MTAAKIARALDGRRCGEWWSSWCPAHDDRSPSLSLSDGERCLILKCWAGCDSREVLAELRRMQLLAGCNEDARPAPAQICSADRAYAARRMALACRIWDAGGRGSLVMRYLANRGITTILMPLSLRSAPACRHPSDIELPAMIARVDNIDSELIGIHRTFCARTAAAKPT